MNKSTDDMLLSLEGLSVGDAFGELFFTNAVTLLLTRRLPPGRWRWTDDTHMALSIVETLREYNHIDQDALSQAFATRFSQEPYRGYGRGTMSLLSRVSQGEDWREITTNQFGNGSYGNGAAMRVAPIGGFFGGDPDRAAVEAQRSAIITHAHPEGQAGAIAVAVAAAPPTGCEFLEETLKFVPPGMTHKQIRLSLDIPSDNSATATQELGTGMQITAPDTVPYCLWCAAYHLSDYAEALWWTIRGPGRL